MTISAPVLGHSTKIRRKTDQKGKKRYKQIKQLKIQKLTELHEKVVRY